jgi:site-specific DNA-methyltransferase (adenine-specific)
LGRLALPGALVADPFAGSGSFAIACREVGLKYVGTEEDKITCKIAQDRLAEQV